MRLHEDETLFRQAITATADHFGLPTSYIEKDYLVTYALYKIFTLETAEYTVFKGGTALVKCFGLIDRFFEDIDLALIRSEGISGNALKKKLRAITTLINDTLPEVNKEWITSKGSMIRKTTHEFEPIFSGGYGQVRQNIILESS